MNRKPELVVVAGPNGSGKTSITEQLLLHTWTKDCRYINPDLIAKDDFGDWNSPAASLSAAKKAQRLREEYLQKGENFAFETVFSAPDKIEFVRRAKAQGYFIRFFFVCTNGPEINQARIQSRVREGGHHVPPAKVVSRYGKSITQCATIIGSVDRAYIYDNSVEDMPPALLFRTENGMLKKLYCEPIKAWARPILAVCR